MTTLFKKDELIRRITEDGTGEIILVLESPDYSTESVYCARQCGGEVDRTYIDPSDYELVTDNQPIVETKTMEPNTPTRTTEDINEDISKMFIQVAQYMRANTDAGKITLQIETEYHSGDELEVSFNARIGYEEIVTSTSLFKSAEVAIARSNENDGLKPLSLSMHREAAE